MSAIEWTQETWNPIAGCSKVSAGCANCYAEKMAARLEAMGQKKYEGLTVLQGSHSVWTGKIAFDEEALLAPLRRKKPTTYFVNSMSDLFHENVTDEQIDRVIAVMALCPQHTFQVLTKRPERMLRYFNEKPGMYRFACIVETAMEVAQCGFVHPDGRVVFERRREKMLPAPQFPLPNLWLGVSVENQKMADERIPLLLQTPAAVRFISAEPLLEDINLDQVANSASLAEGQRWLHSLEGYAWETQGTDYYDVCNIGTKLDWVIVGGESGPGARPFNVEWARSIVKQCAAAGVPCFVKQMGSHVIQDGERRVKRDRKGGDMHEWPHDLRVRQMPEVRA